MNAGNVFYYQYRFYADHDTAAYVCGFLRVTLASTTFDGIFADRTAVRPRFIHEYVISGSTPQVNTVIHGTPRNESNAASIMGVVAPPTTGFYRTTIISSVSYIRIHMNENKNRYNGEVRTTNCFVIDECLYICSLSLRQITISFHVSYIERIYTVEKGGKQYTDSEHNLKKKHQSYTPAHTHIFIFGSHSVQSLFFCLDQMGTRESGF